MSDTTTPKRILRSSRKLSQVQPQPQTTEPSSSTLHHQPPLPQSTTVVPASVCPKKRRASKSPPAEPENTGISGTLTAAGVTVGCKRSRHRLLELLDRYVKPKRSRLAKGTPTPNPTPTPTPTPNPNPNPNPNMETQVVRGESTGQDMDFNLFEIPQLITMVEGVGLDGKNLPKADLVKICKEYRELIILPTESFQFTFKPSNPTKSVIADVKETCSPQTLPLEGPTSSQIRWKGKSRAQSSAPSFSSELASQEGTPLSPALQDDPPSHQELPSPRIETSGPSRKQVTFSKSSDAPLPPNKKSSSKNIQKSKDCTPIQDSETAPILPSLQHSRFLHPRPRPTTLPPPDPSAPTKKHLSESDHEWSPRNENFSNPSDLSETSEIEEDYDLPSRHPPSAKKDRKSASSSTPSRPPDTESLPSSPVRSSHDFDKDGDKRQNLFEDAQNEPDRLTRIVFQLKHCVTETNKRVDKVVKDLKILSNVVRSSTNIPQTPSPTKKTRGGRSASWMRMHIDTLLGRRPGDQRLPPSATAAEQEAWKCELDVEMLEPELTTSQPSAAPSNPSSPHLHGPAHVNATPQQLSVMRTMMQAAGVSSFRPDFAQSSNSEPNKWLWALAFQIFVKLVECGEYSGVSLDSENMWFLKKLMSTRIRSLTKEFQQESWAEDRKKRAASSARRCARLRYLKKNRERNVLGEKRLWSLSPIIQVACSDDETDHEGCLDPLADQHKSPCHIRKLTWRSLELENIFILLDQRKARMDDSIPKPGKSSPTTSAETSNDDKPYTNNGRPARPRLRCPNGSPTTLPPASGLPIDCYSPDWLNTLTAMEISQLEIDSAPVLTSLLPIIKSL